MAGKRRPPRKTLYCDQCPPDANGVRKAFASRRGLLTHLDTVHGSGGTPLRHFCHVPGCGAGFPKRWILDAHRKAKHPDLPPLDAIRNTADSWQQWAEQPKS